MGGAESAGWVTLNDLASIATIAGGLSIIAVFWQIRQQSAFARSTFENLFVQEYQQLIQRLPIKALLGDELSKRERIEYLGEFYHYIDLCNTQAYHHAKRRITESTWAEWHEGIKANFERKELSLVWSYVAAKSPSEFSDLRKVVVPIPCDDANPYRSIFDE